MNLNPYKVGVIGCGVVGSAVAACFGKKFPIVQYDKFKNIGSMAEIIGYADMTFVCVPTPTTDDWKQNLEPLTDVLMRLQTLKFKGPVVVKCTVVPGTMDRMQKNFPDLRLVHNPEFLTEAKARTDFEKQTMVLLSGKAGDVQEVLDAYRRALNGTASAWFSDFKTTELAKYIHNCLLATKVAFLNEMYDYADAIGTKYDDAVKAAISQGVIGESHTRVPGPDGKRGFGGMCFPKDTKALWNSKGGSLLSILGAAIESNDVIRRDGDL
jgi:UDPglucose 6-dehydrogenase